MGFARRDWDGQDFDAEVRKAVMEHCRTPFDEDVWKQLQQGTRFVAGTFDDEGAYDELRGVLEELDELRGTGGNRAFYLSIPPRFFAEVCQQLQAAGLSTPEEGSWRRVVIEKPFGHDEESARELNAIVEEVFPPDSIFRIDHYLSLIHI